MTTWSGTSDFESEDWLRSGEVLHWSGCPETQPLFIKQDLLSIAFALFYCGFSLFWISNAGPIFFVGFPFVAIGVYLLVGRFFYKHWLLRHSRYAVTSQRFVEIRNNQLRTEMSRGVTYQVRRNVGRDRAQIDFTSGNALAVAQSGVLGAFGSASFPFGLRNGGLTFRNLSSTAADDALRAIESPVGSSFSLTTSRARPLAAAPSSVLNRWFTSVRGDHEVRVVWWIRTRLLRRPYAMTTPLTADEVLRALDALVAPTGLQTVFGTPPGTIVGKVNAQSVMLRAGSGGTSNSWRWVFHGRVSTVDVGTELAGNVGPSSFTPVFSAVWTSPLLIAIIIMIGVFVARIVHGQFSLLFRGAPFVLIPIGFLSFFCAVTEFASRSAAREWAAVDLMLQEILNPSIQ